VLFHRGNPPPAAVPKFLFLGRRRDEMLDEEWIQALADGRRVKFTYQELPDDGAFITAQIERNKFYSILLAKAKPA
jgi:hypothetical protein